MACASDEKSDLDPNTFAGKYVDDLRYNCEQGVECAAFRGDLTQEEISDDPRGKCLKETAANVNAYSPEEQLRLVVRFNTCRSLTHCQYVDCLSNQAMGFGEAQRPAIDFYCNARMECDMVRGTFSGTASDFLMQCVAFKIAELNQYTTDNQQAFTRDFPPCTMNAGCAFFDCFRY